MKCHLCGEDKLSEEFPYYAPSEKCDHALLHCLKCVTNEIEKNESCSECGSRVEKDGERYAEYMETLEILFPKVQNVVSPVTSDGNQCIAVTNLAGECATYNYKPDQTIEDLKNNVKHTMHIPCENQMLLYNGCELKTKEGSGRKMTLADHNVQPNGTIRLLVRLYEVPHQLDNVTFELFWGFPAAGKDYLDATVFFYSGLNFVEMVDYDHRISRFGSVKHSGDIIYLESRRGQHTIHVSIKSLQSYVDTLVFTLSSWNAPNISQFKTPSLRFFDKKFPEKKLCSDEMGHAANSQAIIMCCLTKRENGWEVHSLKTLSSGNAKNYEPLKATIVNVIQQGFMV